MGLFSAVLLTERRVGGQEYADGGSLWGKICERNTVPPQRFDEDQILWYGYQLASALEHIHCLGIIHRDIKSENVFVMRNDVIKLGDFGLASISTPNQSQTQGSVGTPFYMAPELVQGERYGAKVDIYAMGCVLHELAALTRAFSGENLPAIVMKIVEGTREPIGDPFSTALQQLVDECLSSSGGDRPSAAALLEKDRFKNSVGGSSEQEKEVSKRCREAQSQAPTRLSSDSSVKSMYSNLSASFNVVEADSRLYVALPCFRTKTRFASIPFVQGEMAFVPHLNIRRHITGTLGARDLGHGRSISSRNKRNEPQQVLLSVAHT